MVWHFRASGWGVGCGSGELGEGWRSCCRRIGTSEGYLQGLYKRHSASGFKLYRPLYFERPMTIGGIEGHPEDTMYCYQRYLFACSYKRTKVCGHLDLSSSARIPSTTAKVCTAKKRPEWKVVSGECLVAGGLGVRSVEPTPKLNFPETPRPLNKGIYLKL